MYKIPRQSRGGFTLVEVLISVAVLGLAFSSIAMLAQANSDAASVGAVEAALESRSTATIDRISAELAIAGAEGFTLEDANTLRYRHPEGVTGAEVDWGEFRELRFEYEVGELDDGVDNNGNGLVDEGQVVLVENVGLVDERRLLITRWVREHAENEDGNGIDDDGNGVTDENGFFLQRAGDTVIVELTLERPTSKGTLLDRTSSISVQLRN